MDPVPASVLTLEQLPDDVIVMVLQYLPVKDVLDCRLVCKRLCGLAVHWDVWRHRSLKDDVEYAGAVLHLAPCLDTLTVTGRVPTLAVTTTSCAVASLELHSNYGMAINAAEYALAVRNQEFLGRLRKLELNTDLTTSDVLVRTVAMCSNLESLEIIGYLPNVTHPIVRGPSRPSLTNFRCPVEQNSASFVNTILAGHAATLEQVNLGVGDDFAETRTAELLVTMPRLRSLRCDKSFCGLNIVSECKTLTDVSIFVGVDSELENIDVLSNFLRRANQLRRVHLDCLEVEEDCLPEVSAALIKALVSTGLYHLERLALEGVTDVRSLLRALPALPALRHLDLDAEPDDELLKSITPVTAPALRLLEIAVKSGQCPHAWIHGAAVKATLAENPSLHIQLWCAGDKCNPKNCETCAIGCHRKVKWRVVRKIGLYSHDPDKCPSPEEHTDDVDWDRSYDRSSNVACKWIHM